MSELTTRRNDEAQRYEVLVDDQVAGIVDYRWRDDVMVLPHTETFPGHEGKGVGSAAARAALDDARAQGVQVDPSCPFIASWIEKHPDYADLVAD